MDGLGNFLSTIFSRPRLSWAALTLAAGLIVLASSRIEFLPQGQIADVTIAIAWVTVFVASAFFVLTVAVDAFKALTANSTETSEGRANLTAVQDSSEDAKAILAYLALQNERSVWVMQSHPGAFGFRASGFGTLTDTHGAAAELTLLPSKAQWLQANLNAIGDLKIAQDAAQRFRESNKRAMEEIEHRWMTY